MAFSSIFTVYLSTSWHSPVYHGKLQYTTTHRQTPWCCRRAGGIHSWYWTCSEWRSCLQQRSKVKGRKFGVNSHKNLQLGEYFTTTSDLRQFGLLSTEIWVEGVWDFMLALHNSWLDFTEYWACKALDLWSYMHCYSIRTTVQYWTRKKGGCGHVMRGL